MVPKRRSEDVDPQGTSEKRKTQRGPIWTGDTCDLTREGDEGEAPKRHEDASSVPVKGGGPDAGIASTAPYSSPQPKPAQSLSARTEERSAEPPPQPKTDEQPFTPRVGPITILGTGSIEFFGGRSRINIGPEMKRNMLNAAKRKREQQQENAAAAAWQGRQRPVDPFRQEVPIRLAVRFYDDMDDLANDGTAYNDLDAIVEYRSLSN